MDLSMRSVGSKVSEYTDLREHLQVYKAINDITFGNVDISLHVTLLKVYPLGAPSPRSVVIKEYLLFLFLFLFIHPQKQFKLLTIENEILMFHCLIEN